MTPISYIELSKEALLHNVTALRGIVPMDHFTAVVKANAYGHGLEEIVAMLGSEPDAFQVDDLDELRQLRQLNDGWALVYGYVRLADLEEVSRLRGEVVVFSVDQIAELARIHELYLTTDNPDFMVRFSIKIDALLGRQGILPDEIDNFIEELAKYPDLEPTSAYAHYANIEDTTDLTHAEAQEEAFQSAYAKLEARWPRIGRHISATSGVMAREKGPPYNSMVRLGIGLYGLYPSAPLARSHADLGLRPVMRWVSHLAQVKTLPAGHPVGYGLTYRTIRPTKIGIVPQGYSDGYDRGLSNVGEVLVHGKRCPVIGRIAMNMFAIDLTPAPDARAEDEVVLLGSQGEDRITAEEIASKLGTINYEVVARVSPLLPRVIED